jgi:phosphonate transport system ATP-binding protein
MPESVTMFQLEAVTKSYPGVIALHPLDLTIENGECVALMGPSGSGKSTLLQLLSCGIEPDSGTISIDGISNDQLRPGTDLARIVGIMPQSLDLIPALSVANNVLAGRLGEWGFMRSILSLLSPRDLHLVESALSRVGIPDKIFERTSHLSGGQQQRVALARLLVQEPKAVLVDEPVASVDPARADDLMRLITSLVQENSQTLVASLHSVPLALRYFSRIVALRDGRVVFDHPVDQVTEDDLSQLYVLEDPVHGRA